MSVTTEQQELIAHARRVYMHYLMNEWEEMAKDSDPTYYAQSVNNGHPMDYSVSSIKEAFLMFARLNKPVKPFRAANGWLFGLNTRGVTYGTYPVRYAPICRVEAIEDIKWLSG